ncbi:MAG: glycoside hydrolase family 30 protein, partial [Clostridiaceae bacterium]|nr:glycoside hydrolase family 30 protein [Clostridiaceae bacterium]
EYVKPILSDTKGFDAVDGVAFHDYSGEPTAMSEVHDLFPQKTVGLTERSWWGVWGADRICQYFRNWSINYNMWVTMLDSNIEPHQWVGTPDPTIFVQDAVPDSNGFYDNYWICPEYYLIGQFSKFVRPGAVRIDSNNVTQETISNVAFKNPDGTIAVVVINQQKTGHKFKIQYQGRQINDIIPAKSVATYVWSL